MVNKDFIVVRGEPFLIVKNLMKNINFLLKECKQLNQIYKNIPHLIDKVYENSEEIINRLSSLKKEILNKKYPYLVIVIDTFSDLMMYDPNRFESVISDLSKLNNKGVYIIICDSRPSKDVFTKTLMKSFPTKIAMNLSSEMDSKRVIGIAGAEKLLGCGDMLFLPQNIKKPIRIQAPYISEEEIKKFIKGI